MRNPVSTYRIQFHKNFTFTDFERVIPYLDKLGVRTIYASPVFEAVPGSVHGYDSVNSHRINPEIGTEQQLMAISEQLTERGIGWIQDIVPNHMAFHPHNAWLMDVLEKGQLSPYAPFFDIDWSSPVYEGRLMVPFLGSSLAETIENGELTVIYQSNKLVISNFDTVYPLYPRSYATVLQAGERQPDAAMQALIDQIDTLQLDNPEVFAVQYAAFQEEFANQINAPVGSAYLETCLKTVNATPRLIQQLADEQAYRLCYHGETDYQINYRRFFTINSLICLNTQHTAVFDSVHQYIKTLLEAGVFQGLRIDHIDGLYDPSRYLEQLRQLAGNDVYIVVEKILKTDEDLPAYWPVQGSTGYAFLSVVNNLFTRTRSETNFTRFYQQLLGEKVTVRQELHDKKAYILYEHMGGELDNLCRLLQTSNLTEPNVLNSLPEDYLKNGIGEFLVRCPVYRYYGNRMPLDAQESEAVLAILNRIRAKNPELTPVSDLLNETLLVKPLTADEAYNRRALHFYQRCMQFTGPLMAKGVEDTLMYTYNRFIGHDEVGDSPESFGLTANEFHRWMVDRQAQWPLALNATSTHDTKRGEDVRSRLNVLTDWADAWIDIVQEWQQLNRDLKQKIPSDTSVSGMEAPDVNDEYFIYQTLVGAYPMPGQNEDNFPERLTEYLQKALREAKRHSTYTSPNETYEKATQDFARQLLDQSRPFWQSFQQFHRRVADFGIINSLVQVVLKCTCPGLPDVYQGCELWDLSLVDPDNRRAVDFDFRQQCLDELIADDAADKWLTLWQNRFDARIKLWLVHTLLNERANQPELFATGRYLPLRVEGRYQENVLAFARQHESTWYVVVVPLGLAQLCRDQKDDGFSFDWEDTHVIVPDEAPDQWKNRLLNSSGNADKKLVVNELFSILPLALLKLEETSR